jgi:hypothetical protein
MRRILPMLVYLMAVGVPLVVRADENGPSKDVPELQVLQNYVGTWDVKVTGDEVASGVDTARWILGGRFLEQSGFVVSENGTNRVEVTTLYTFDTTKKVYRSWSFLSTGNTSQAEMTWDARIKTMTSVTRPNADGVRSAITADFSESGKERWKFVFTDRAGKAVGEMSGVNTLRNRSELQPESERVAKEESGKRSAELKILDQFLGTWRTKYRRAKAEWTPVEENGSADLVCTQELAGQMIRERGTYSDQTTSTWLLTYDAEQRKYRSWWFNSLGMTAESNGRWDESTKTLFWTTVEPTEFNTKSQHGFPDSGKCDWKVLVQDTQGVTMFRIEGTSLRVNDPKP